jgi:hypothetical protein
MIADKSGPVARPLTRESRRDDDSKESTWRRRVGRKFVYDSRLMIRTVPPQFPGEALNARVSCGHRDSAYHRIGRILYYP